MKKIILQVLSLLSILTVGAQEVTWPDADIWPESPRARALREVAFASPSMLTGAAEFNVPLYDLNVEGLDLNFTLNYHSNGIKVDSDPAPVGYGWTFAPAFRITRQIMGRPDELFPFVGNDDASTFDNNKCYRALTDSGTVLIATLGEHPRYDSEHDIFTIHMPNKSITAIWNNGEFLSRGASDYRIAGTNNLSEITVTDPYGRIFTFGEKGETGRYETACLEWLLTEITLPSGRKITFDWDELQPQGKNLYCTSGFSRIYSTTSDYPVGWDDTDVGYSTITEAVYTNIHYLSTITFPGGTVEFSYMKGAAQEDRFLTEMKVNTHNGTESAEIYNATFLYGSGNKHGMLTTVNIAGEGEYKFDYIAPRKVKDNGQDLFGYGNKQSSDPLYPNISFKNGLGVSGMKMKSGADRSVNEEAMKTGMLVKATYPTGGSVEWDYEMHKFAPTVNNGADECSLYMENPALECGGGLRVKQITMKSSGDDQAPIIRTYEYGEDGNGLANVVAVPNYSTFVTHGIQYVYSETTGRWARVDFISVGNHSDYMRYQINAVPLWYSEVTEHTDQGYTKYYYENYCEPNSILYGWAGQIPNDINTIFSKGPQMCKREVYKKTGEKVAMETWEYTPWQSIGFSNVAIIRQKYQFASSCAYVNPDFCECRGYEDNSIVPGTTGDITNPELRHSGLLRNYGLDAYIAKTYTINPIIEQLTSHTTTEYYGSSSVTMREEYTYVDDSEIIKSIKRYNVNDSLNSSIITNTYPEAASAMGKKNVIAMPMKTVTQHNTATTTVRYNMKSYGVNGFAPDSIFTYRGSATPLCEATFTYDSYGDVTKRKNADGVITQWEWNTTYNHPTKQTLGGKLISTAKWQPMVGVTELTAPNGTVQTFTYDNYGRLTASALNGVKQQDYTYHIDSCSTYVQSRQYTSSSKYLTTCTNYDGLSRQATTVTSLPSGMIADAVEYNAMGLPERAWSKVPVSSLTATTSTVATAATSAYGDEVPYTLTEYEPSPRGIVTATTKAGAAWHNAGKSATVVRGTATCKKLRADADGVTELGSYPAGVLTTETVTDEDGSYVTTYTDSFGRVVGRRTPAGYTYYAYDDYGDLRYILPPGVRYGAKRTDGTMQRFAYWYDYDEHGRCILKKLPGMKAWEYRYDPAGRLVAESGPDYQSGSWRLHFYDELGREVATSLGTISESKLTSFASAVRKVSLNGKYRAVGTTGYNFSNAQFVLPSYGTYTATYYDDYTFITKQNLGTYFEKDTVTALALAPIFLHVNRLQPADGLVTGIFTGSNYEAYYYDKAGKETQRVATGYNAGRHYALYDSYGVLMRERYVRDDGFSIPRRDATYTYDDAGRITKATYTMGGKTARITTTYDEFGNIASTDYGGNATQTYDYDLHGWPTATSATNAAGKQIYGDRLFYTTGATPRYNGFISSKQLTLNGRYNYTYDRAGRLTSAAYVGNNGEDYSTKYTYDKMSNVTKALRKGVVDGQPIGTVQYGTLDSLVMVYTGNQLTQVSNSSAATVFSGVSGIGHDVDMASLTYDGSGRLTSDPTRGITNITYNRLGKTEWTYFEDGHAIIDEYDGLGRQTAQKRYLIEQQIVSDTITVNVPKLLQTRRYFGDGVIMTDSAWTMARFAGGYFSPSGILTPTIKTAAVGTNLTTATLYSGGAHYYVRDYQGNNVAVIDSVGTAVQTTNYYPYGTPWSNINSHPFLYSDKEWQTTYGANRYSHGARYYVPSLFNFSTPDPLAEKHPDVSTYIYCVGNPIMNIDPLGCDTVNITYNNSVWEIAGTILANGDDVFNVSTNGKTRKITFNDNVEYGKRVNCLNLTVGKNKNDLTLGVYRVSGAVENGTGFYVTPGGAASNKKGSNARILDGTYPIKKPQPGAYWPKPGLGGSVWKRGIRFHYGGGSGASLAKWTDGCFVLFPNYSIQNGAYKVIREDSEKASNAFDGLMGAKGRVKKKELGTKLIHHDGSYFPDKITYSLILKTL